MAERHQRNDATVKDKLRKLYYAPEGAGSYGGVDRLLREARKEGIQISREKIVEFLADEKAYSLHKPARRTYKRNKTYVSGIDAQWQADLADMQSLAGVNGGVKYLLTCIDVFSKFAWVVPIKDKGAKSMLEGFEKLFSQAGIRTPNRLQTDKGSEFLCKPVQSLLKSKGIQHFASNSDKKAAVVERFNRTLKTRIWTYFTAKETQRYVDVLPQFVLSYNATVHRSIGMRPDKVRPVHTNVIWKRLYGDGSVGPLRTKINGGELVRISRWKGNFEKGYMPNWSKETFHVAKVVRQPQTMYEIHDKEGEPLRGNFYGRELQKVKSGEYVVEKILRQRRRSDSSYEVLVKWQGWSSKYNSWVPKDTLSDHT
jgi:transposase InsO family protein